MAANKKHVKQSNPAEIVASLDVITDIMVRLPLRKLIQFQLVSKRWLSFIKSSGFDRSRDLHQIHTSVRNFVACTDFASIRYVDFLPIEANMLNVITSSQRKSLTLSQDTHDTRILHSCNGLLLCSNFRLNEKAWKYYVFNIETNECSVIREPDGCEVLGVCLVFDPSKSTLYQAVCVVRLNCVSGSHSRNVFQIYIYCSKTSVWRKSGEPFSKYINYEEGVYWSGVYWNGSVHWIDRVAYKFVRYDIEDHAFKDIPLLPEYIFCNRCNCYFGASRDRLNAFLIKDPNYMFDIYQMRKDYSGWYIKHRIHLSHMIDAYAQIWPDQYQSLRVLTVVRGEKDADTCLVLGTPGKAVRCNLFTRIIEKLHDF